jgi:hypothetical protein
MALSELNLTTNKNLVSLQSETLRQSESGLILKANLLMPDGSPYDLSDKTVIFNEHKANDKYIVDTNVKPVDEAHGSISYQLHPQAYAASGTAWFEIQDSSGNVVDSTQDFYLNVKDAANASIYNSNYIYKLDSLRDQLQQIVDSADGSLKAELQKMADGLTQKLNDMQTAYNASDKQWQDTFKQSEQSRADDYTAEKNKRLADDQANAKAFKDAQDQRDADYQADKNKRNSDFASQQETINAAAKTQRDTISQQWSAKQTQLVQDWTTKRETLDTELTKLENTVNTLQAAVDQLNQTDLPNAQQKMDALEAEIQKAEQTFSQVDFSKFVTSDELAAKTSGTIVTAYDIASKHPTTVKNSYTSEELVDQGVLGQFADQINQLNSKVDVDGPLFKHLTQFNNWSDLFDGYSVNGVTATNGNRLVAFRDDTVGGNTVGSTGAGIAFGGSDTKGVLSVAWGDHHARITGGNGDKPVWSEDIAWKSDLTGYAKTVSLNGGDKIEPDSTGNVDLTVPQPDLTGYAKTSDVTAAISPVQTTADEAKTAASRAQSTADANTAKINAINASISQLQVAKHFTDASAAQTYSAAHPTTVCIVDG